MFEDGNSLSDTSAMEQLEVLLGCKFPGSYRELVLSQDGGYSELGVNVFSRDKDRNIFVEFSHLIPFVYHNPALTMRGYNTAGGTPHKPDELIAFAEDGAGFLFCFDYRESDIPTIGILTNNWVDEPIIPVASDFDTFIASLIPDKSRTPDEEADQDWDF
jgi:hypothetical protein